MKANRAITWARRAAIVAAVLGLATACSSSGKGSSDASSAPTGAEPSAPTATPIAVGSIGSFSGAEGSTLLGGQFGIKAWAAWTNAHGGLNGHRIKLYVMDDTGDAAMALTDVKTLVESDHVVAIVGDQSNQDSSWASYVQAKGVPVVGGLSLQFPFMTNPDFYPQGTNVIALNYGALSLAKAQGLKYGLFYCAEAPVCAQAAPLFKAIGSGLGVDVSVSQPVSGSAVSYAAQCEALKGAGVQSYQLGVAQAVVTKMSADCKKAGVKAKLIGTDGNITLASLTGTGEQGMIAVEANFPFMDASTPQTQAFQSAIKQYAPTIGPALGPNAVYSWVSGELLAAAVKASNSSDVTPTSVKQGLYALPKGDTLDGIAPPLTFTADKPTLVNCYFIEGIENNKLVEPQGLKTSCAPDATVGGIVANLK